jgi:alkylation response protein AidB-like acyl-CoA dehydrogenase
LDAITVLKKIFSFTRIQNPKPMAEQYMSMNTLNYMLYDVHDLAGLLKYPRYSEYDEQSTHIFIDSIKAFADKDCFPYIKEMDDKPVYYKDGQVIVHPQVEPILRKSGEMGLIGSMLDYEHGGMQLPSMMYQSANFIIDAANNHVSGYAGLTSGSAGLIAAFASQDLKDRYLPQMIAGNWSGTMCLTEPQAGSSLSDITTTAYTTDKGYYHIKGQKIWISGGDNHFTENVVHLLLARIDGAPAGTKGISLFVVPKNRVDENGKLIANGVFTAGDFQKLGQRGYATTHLVFGEQECRGWLVGEANKGLSYMFQMMNGARISVGRHGVSIATAAYYASLQYAHERPQGRRLSDGGKKDLSQGQTLIINHPDIRRMLLLQKAIAEGSLSLLLQTARYHDMEKVAESAAEKEEYHLLLEILTPIAKTYPSEMGQVAVSNGIQVLGGMGYSAETILQQYYRDIRILAIYEGTTGIQSLDLLARKVTMDNGKALQLLTREINSTITAAVAHPQLKPYAEILKNKLSLNEEVLAFLVPFAMQGNFERYLTDATVYMSFLGTIVVGWQWLKLATKAREALNQKETKYPPAFYESQIHTMKFFFKYELTKTDSLATTIKSADELNIVSEKELII